MPDRLTLLAPISEGSTINFWHYVHIFPNVAWALIAAATLACSLCLFLSARRVASFSSCLALSSALYGQLFLSVVVLPYENVAMILKLWR